MALSVTEFIDKFKDLLESSDSIEEVRNKYTKLSDTFDLTTIAAGNLGQKVKEVTKNLSEGFTWKGLKELAPALQDIENRLDSAGFRGASLGLAMASIAPGVISGLSAFDSLGAIGDNAQNLTAQMSTLAGNLEKAGALKGPLKWAADVAKAGDAAKNMENQLLSNMYAAGQFNEFYKSMSGSFEGLNSKVLQFSNLTADIGSAMGLTSEQVAKLAQETMVLPGVFDQTVKSGDKTFHQLDAAIRVARGTGLDYMEVQREITRMTQEYGATVQDSVETIARMQEASDTLGLNLKDMKTYVKDAGDQFKFFGDNSSSALDIMAKFGPALSESGLGPAAVAEIVGGFTRGVSQMGVAQRAFLSSQTGIGGGGLRGGLEIEEMLAEGKAGDVAAMVEAALRKLGGGEILSRKEAIAGGPGAASQFEFQRSLLQQGPFGKLAGSDAEAAKLLEALSKGDRGGLTSKLKGGPEVLAGAMERGEKIATRQNNVLIKANNELSKISAFSSTIAYDTTRAAIGVEGGLLVSKEMLGNLQTISQATSRSKLIKGNDSTEGVGGPTSADFANNLLDSIKKIPGVSEAISAAGMKIPTKLETPPKPEGSPTVPPMPGPTTGLTVPPRPAEAIAPDVNKRAAAAARAPLQTQPGPQGQKQSAPMTHEIVIRVMGKEDVLEIVKLSLNEFGQMMIDEEYNKTMTG